LNRALESFLAPEIYEGIAPNLQTDIYSVGCCLYFITFYEPSKNDSSADETDFYSFMDKFEIDMEKVLQQERFLSKRFGI
jgi:calcium-dependent protein kinase